MLGTFSALTPYLKLKTKYVIVDNFIFQLHYRWTFIILLAATILVCSRQFIGEHIKCLSQTIPENVINTYCFFTTTFTLMRQNKDKNAFSGIGPEHSETEPVKRHAYYQWVPFVLFGQALLFYIPHFLWKQFEGGRIKALVDGMRMIGLTQHLNKESKQIGQLNVPSMEETESRIKCIRRAIIDRIRANQSWGGQLVFMECLNFLNILLQIYVTNRFLGGEFYSLGQNIMKQRGGLYQNNVLDAIFPKITKCSFKKYGSGGSLQNYDVLCVMALNVVNEKIYVLLWFWYIFVLAMTIFGMIWRLCTFFLYKNILFTKITFSYFAKPGRIDTQELAAVLKKCDFSTWIFLSFLRSNLSGFIFKRVILDLASELPRTKKNINAYNPFKRNYSANTADPSDEVPLKQFDNIWPRLNEQTNTFAEKCK